MTIYCRFGCCLDAKAFLGCRRESRQLVFLAPGSWYGSYPKVGPTSVRRCHLCTTAHRVATPVLLLLLLLVGRIPLSALFLLYSVSSRESIECVPLCPFAHSRPHCFCSTSSVQCYRCFASRKDYWYRSKDYPSSLTRF